MIDERRSISSRSEHRFTGGYTDLHVVYEGGNRPLRVHLPNISTKGMFIPTPDGVPVGSIVKVSFVLERSKRQVEARAEVRYAVDGAGIGVEFIELPGDDEQAIRDEYGG